MALFVVVIVFFQFPKFVDFEREILDVQERDVEHDSHIVTLSCVVAFIVVIIKDVLVAIWPGGSNVLELLKVKRVCQHVVGVDTLQRLVSNLAFLKSGERIFEHDEHIQGVTRVLLFFDSPIAVFFVETLPVVANIFVEFNVTDGN